MQNSPGQNHNNVGWVVVIAACLDICSEISWLNFICRGGGRMEVGFLTCDSGWEVQHLFVVLLFWKCKLVLVGEPLWTKSLFSSNIYFMMFETEALGFIIGIFSIHVLMSIRCSIFALWLLTSNTSISCVIIFDCYFVEMCGMFIDPATEWAGYR